LRLKISVALLILALLVGYPSAAMAMDTSILGYDASSPQTWTGIYADNYVDGTITFGQYYDTVVNSAYVIYDDINGVEVGWTKDHYTGGSTKGPYMFSAKMYYGIYTIQEHGNCSNNTWYRWKTQSTGQLSNDWDIYFNTTWKWRWTDLAFYYGYPQTGVERFSDAARVDTHFKNVTKRGTNLSWYLWGVITIEDNDPIYRAVLNGRTEWWTVLQ